jgi:hypothetical protein
MMEIFLIQLLAAGLGALSTAWADWSYSGARIGRRLHAFWVAISIAVICVPVVSWTSVIFFGSGLLGPLVAGTVVGAIFLWVHQNLPKSREVRKFGPGLPGAHGAGAVPPDIQTRRVNRVAEQSDLGSAAALRSDVLGL